jgi:hypothetical protein
VKGTKAQRAVFLAGAVMTVVLFAGHPGELTKGSRYKQLWAIGVLTLILAAAADFAPELVVPLAVAIVVGFTIRNPGAFSRFLKGQAAPNKYTRGGPPGLHGPVGSPDVPRKYPRGIQGPIGAGR